GLRDLAGLKNLTTLSLPFKVTDTTLRTLHELDVLHALPQATTRDGKRPQSAREVETLDLEGLEVTDAGLKQLRDLKNLQSLLRRNTDITDAGLKELAALKKLTRLSLSIPVTDTTLTTLHEIDLLHALPQATAREGKRPTSALEIQDLDLKDL